MVLGTPGRVKNGSVGSMAGSMETVFRRSRWIHSARRVVRWCLGWDWAHLGAGSCGWSGKRPIGTRNAFRGSSGPNFPRQISPCPHVAAPGNLVAQTCAGGMLTSSPSVLYPSLLPFVSLPTTFKTRLLFLLSVSYFCLISP